MLSKSLNLFLNKKRLFFFLAFFNLNCFAYQDFFCKNDEQTIASCSTERGVIVAICGKNLQYGIDGYIEYRFIKNNKIEMIYKVAAKNSNKMYRGTYEGTYSVFFGFKRNEYSYIIEVPQEIEGARMNVSVRKNGLRLATIFCKKNNWKEEKNLKTPLLIELDAEEIMEGKFE